MENFSAVARKACSKNRRYEAGNPWKRSYSKYCLERDLQEPAMKSDETYPLGRLHLRDNFSSSPTHWQCKLFEVQAIVSRRLLSSPIHTVTIETKWELLGRMGIDISSELSSTSPAGNQGFSIVWILLPESIFRLPVLSWKISWKKQTIYMVLGA